MDSFSFLESCRKVFTFFSLTLQKTFTNKKHRFTWSLEELNSSRFCFLSAFKIFYNCKFFLEVLVVIVYVCFTVQIASIALGLL